MGKGMMEIRAKSGKSELDGFGGGTLCWVSLERDSDLQLTHPQRGVDMSSFSRANHKAGNLHCIMYNRNLNIE